MSKKLAMLLAAALGLVLVSGCSSTNLNAMRFSATGIWVKGSPFDTQTPGRVELGAGYTSFTLFPLMRGQGFTVDAKTYEVFGGALLFSETITVTAVDKDVMVAVEQKPESLFSIPYLLDVRMGEPAAPTVTIVPVDKQP